MPLASQALDWLPLWAPYAVTVAFGLLAVESGIQLGRWWQKRRPSSREGALGSLVTATLALLAFLLAFLTGVGVTRFDARRLLIVDDANAILASYLRAGYLDEPARSESRALLSEYAALQIAVYDPQRLLAALSRSDQIHRELWARAEALEQARPDHLGVSLYIAALNEMIGIHAKRLAAARARIPAEMWLAIYFVAALTLALVGFHHSYHGARNPIALVALVLIFATVLLLSVDLDRSREGFLQVSLQPLYDLIGQINAIR
jgi:hypothetical protein